MSVGVCWVRIWACPAAIDIAAGRVLSGSLRSVLRTCPLGSLFARSRLGAFAPFGAFIFILFFAAAFHEARSL
jgi:hypothetical protein